MVGSTDHRISYEGNNSTVTTYAVPFRFEGTGLLVTLTTELGAVSYLELGVDAIIGGDGHSGTGTIRTAIAYDSTYRISIWRQTPSLQSLQLVNDEPFSGPSLENALDLLALAGAEKARKWELADKVTRPLIRTELPVSGEGGTVADCLGQLCYVFLDSNPLNHVTFRCFITSDQDAEVQFSYWEPVFPLMYDGAGNYFRITVDEAGTLTANPI